MNTTDQERAAELERAGQRYDIEQALATAGGRLTDARRAEQAAMAEIAELAHRGLAVGLQKTAMASAARVSRPHLDRLLEEDP